MGDDPLSAARTALAATDTRLADADRRLATAVHNAHRLAVDSVHRLEAVRSDIDAAVGRRRTDTATAAREFARFLLDKNREISAVVERARSAAAAEAVALQSLISEYSR